MRRGSRVEVTVDGPLRGMRGTVIEIGKRIRTSGGNFQRVAVRLEGPFTGIVGDYQFNVTELRALSLLELIAEAAQ